MAPPRRAGLLLALCAVSALAVAEPAAAQPARPPEVRFLDARNRPLDPARDAAGVSHRITNDASLPRTAAFGGTSPDPEAIRVELSAHVSDATVRVEAIDPATGAVRSALRAVPLAAVDGAAAMRSPWLRLVGDRIDAEAPGVENRVLRVALGDRVRATVRPSDGAPVTATIPVGRPGSEVGPRAARRAHLRIRVLRLTPGGRPVIGRDDADAIRIARDQVAVANEIWVQCFVGFGDPDAAEVALIDPPPPALLAVADGNGLPAAGGGRIRLRVDDRPVGPVATREGDPPVVTALRVAAALRRAGYRADVTENRPTESGAGRSADVVVRRRGGALAHLSADGARPLSTDARQSVQVAGVDLTDGLQEFRNTDAGTGTLEERALMKTVMDDDPTTIDLVVINGFSSGTRQGEAFIEGDGGSLVNAVILDRNGLRQQRAAWTQAHEIGHVLLDDPYHPDNVGPDRPWLLMDSDTSLPRVTGPKRLTPEECQRVRRRSGVDAIPPLLSPGP